MPTDRISKLLELAAQRRMLLAADDGWAEYDQAQNDDGMAKLNKIQAAILQIGFDDPYTKLIALGVLLDDNADPNFSDGFKNDLFEALRQSKPFRASDL